MLETKEFYEMAQLGYIQVANKALAEVSSIDTLIKMMEKPEVSARTTVPEKVAAALNGKRRPGRPRKQAPSKVSYSGDVDKPKQKRRKLSAASRKAISQAQKRRHQAARDKKALLAHAKDNGRGAKSVLRKAKKAA